MIEKKEWERNFMREKEKRNDQEIKQLYVEIFLPING